MSHHHDHSDHHHHGHHDHDHTDHEHGHHHHHDAPGVMSFAEKTEKILVHWQKHNTDHAKTYGEWAEKAREHGMEEVAGLIREVEEMTLAINARFEAALKKIGH